MKKKLPDCHPSMFEPPWWWIIFAFITFPLRLIWRILEMLWEKIKTGEIK